MGNTPAADGRVAEPLSSHVSDGPLALACPHIAGRAESPLVGRASASELSDHPFEVVARFSDQRSQRILSGLSVRTTECRACGHSRSTWALRSPPSPEINRRLLGRRPNRGLQSADLSSVLVESAPEEREGPSNGLYLHLELPFHVPKLVLTITEA